MVVVHHIPLRPASWLALAACTLAAGCSSSRPDPTPAGPVVHGSVMTHAGAIDLDLAGAGDLPPGTLLRLVPPDGGDLAPLLGVAVVTANDAQGVRARVVRLDDPRRPIEAGDRALPGDGLPPAPAPIAPDPERLRQAAELERRDLELAALRRAVAGRDLALAAMHAELARRPLPEPAPEGAEYSRLAADLARVEAERAYFDLALKVLALERGAPAVDALQDAVRTALEARADLEAREDRRHE